MFANCCYFYYFSLIINEVKWATSHPTPYSTESGTELALQDKPILAWIVGYLIFGVPVVLLILGKLILIT